jgi:predicted Zn-ribbon and HTH transcriptional regulator
MNQVLQSAQEKAVLELKALVTTARDTLLDALNEKVVKLSHQEEQEVLALVLKPTNEQSTGYVTKRTKVIIDELVGVAAKKAKPTNQQSNQPKKHKQATTLINTNKGNS